MRIDILLSVFLVLGIIVLLVVAIFAIKTYKVYKNNSESLSYNNEEVFIIINYKDDTIIVSLDSIVSLEIFSLTTCENIKRYGLSIKCLGNIVEDLYFDNTEERDNIYNFITSQLYNNGITYREYDEHIVYL